MKQSEVPSKSLNVLNYARVHFFSYKFTFSFVRNIFSFFLTLFQYLSEPWESNTVSCLIIFYTCTSVLCDQGVTLTA